MVLMTTRQRKLLFWTACGLFIVLSPLVALYSLGYSFDFETGMPVKTSSLRLSANTEANVRINGVSVGSTSFFSGSFSQSRLLPNQYMVELQKTGFRPWAKTVRLQPSEFMDFPKVILIPDEIKTELYATVSFDPKTLAVRGGELIVAGGPDIKKSKNQKPSPFPAQLTLITIPEAVVRLASANQIPTILDGIQFDKTLPSYLDQSGRPLIQPIHAREFPGDGRTAWFNDRSVFITWAVQTSYQPFIDAFTTSSPVIFNAPIREVVWHKDGEHLYVLAGESLYFIDIDFRGAIQKYVIATDISGTIAYSGDHDSLFVQKGRSIFRLNVDF